MCFPHLFPYGKNGYLESRIKAVLNSLLCASKPGSRITIHCVCRICLICLMLQMWLRKSNYLKQILSIVRCINWDYIIYISNNLRYKNGNSSRKLTAADIRNVSKGSELAKKSYMFIRNVRGTPAYFRDSLYNLISMLKNIGCPHMFMTLSWNEIH